MRSAVDLAAMLHWYPHGDAVLRNVHRTYYHCLKFWNIFLGILRMISSVLDKSLFGASYCPEYMYSFLLCSVDEGILDSDFGFSE